MDTNAINVTSDDLPSVCRRLPGESQEAYHAFMTYLCGGEKRSQAQTQRLIGHKAPGVVGKWSAEYDWVDRCKVYDEWLYTCIAARQSEDKIKEMLGRHSEQAAEYLLLIKKIGASFMRRIELDPKVLDDLPIAQHIEYVIRICSVLGKLQEAEALANGLTPTRRIELTGAGGGEVKFRMLAPLVVEGNSVASLPEAVVVGDNEEAW